MQEFNKCTVFLLFFIYFVEGGLLVYAKILTETLVHVIKLSSFKTLTVVSRVNQNISFSFCLFLSVFVNVELYQCVVRELCDPVCWAGKAGSGSEATEEAAWAILMNSLLESDE